MFAYEVAVSQLDAFVAEHRASNEAFYRAWVQLVLVAESYAALDHHDAETREEALGDAWQDIEAGFRGAADVLAVAAAFNVLWTAGPLEVSFRRAVNRAFREAWAATPPLFHSLYPKEIRKRRLMSLRGPWRPVLPERGYQLGAALVRDASPAQCAERMAKVVTMRKLNMQLVAFGQAPPEPARPARPTLTLVEGGRADAAATDDP